MFDVDGLGEFRTLTADIKTESTGHIALKSNLAFENIAIEFYSSHGYDFYDQFRYSEYKLFQKAWVYW